MPEKERFAVSHEGMREQHAGRAPWELVKELVQNAWDEAPNATVCQVDIISESPDTTRITVTDDGPGFADIADSYTLLRATPKRRDPNKRGRFNLGEKEFISVATCARVETAGHTVTFPLGGGRRVSRNKRTRGTVITALMPWNQTHAEDLRERLAIFRPTGCALVVNGQEIPRREPLAVHSAVLDTVLQDGPGEPVRRTRRRTEVHLLPQRLEAQARAADATTLWDFDEIQNPGSVEQSWLYEMGIPIQPIDTPWDIDVQQKVPMPPNRTETPTRYLQTIYAEALNAGYNLLEPEEFGRNWVKAAMQENRVEKEPVVATVQGRYGEKAVFTSNDADANMRASEKGYQLINPRSLSTPERNYFRNQGEVKSAREVFGIKPDSDGSPAPDRPEYPAFAAWVQELARNCGLHASVSFIDNPTYRIVADCTADNEAPNVRFNIAATPEAFFLPPFNRTKQLELVIHELGHAIARKGMEHGPQWGNAVARTGALIARYLLQSNQEPPDQGPGPGHGPGGIEDRGKPT